MNATTPTDLKQLLPCPFCGREMEVRNGYIAHPHGDCAATHIVLNHNAAGIEAWNTRTLSEENRALREATCRMLAAYRELKVLCGFNDEQREHYVFACNAVGSDPEELTP